MEISLTWVSGAKDKYILLRFEVGNIFWKHLFTTLLATGLLGRVCTRFAYLESAK